MRLGKGATNDVEGFFVSIDFKYFRKGVCGWGRGPLMMVKDYLFQLILYVLERGPTNDDEGISVYTDFKCFRKGVH